MRCLIGLSILTVLSAQTTPSHTTDIWKADLSFDQLAQINVTTASRHREELFTTAAAITVVNHSDAHARGATSIPEILRYVPGLNVSQINANTWAIGARGFQWQNANKLLVMIDGRSIYDSVGSGVRWESNAIFLPDLDRIEVVRGPGASTWGANAVNGVINILSRSAFDTLGTSAYIATGNQLQLSAGIRQGLQLSNQSALRVHAMTRLDDDNLLPSGASADDGSRFAQTGFRYDRSFNNTSRLNVIGDAFTQSNEYQRTLASLSAPPPYSFLSDDDIQSQGASLQTNFKTTRDTAHWLEAKAYWNWLLRDRPQDKTDTHTFDFDISGGLRPDTRHQLTTGLSARFITAYLEPKIYAYARHREQTGLISTFIQDTWRLSPALTFTGGSKFEWHEDQDIEALPSLRLSWQQSNALSLWTSLGRAIRTPTITERYYDADVRTFPPGVLSPTLPSAIHVSGNPDLKSETLLNLELGLRWQPHPSFHLEASTFSFRYDDYALVTAAGSTIESNPAHFSSRHRFTNGIHGESYGGELSLGWKPQPDLTINTSYSYVNIQLHTQLADTFEFELDELTTPRGTFLLEAEYHFTPKHQLHLGLRHLDAVKYYDIPAYWELDARYAYSLSSNLECALIGKNLLDAQHPEYDSAINRSMTEIQRSLILSITWRH